MQRSKNPFRSQWAVPLVWTLILAGPITLTAQVDTGTILGTVRDQTGGVLPGAKVTLTNEDTNFSISTVAGEDGAYIFTPVKIGTYTVSAEVKGFRKEARPHATVNVQQQAVVDFELAPGQMSQTTEVTAAPPLLQTQSGSVGQVVGARSINDLPLNGRNYTFLAQLTAGVTFAQHDNRGLGDSGNFSANGTRAAQNNYLLDGIDNNNDQADFRSGTAFVVRPPVDAIQEFKVQTNAFSAEFGRAGGAVLNATIKSGTNGFHGDAWEFLRNDKLDAADFFQNSAGQPKGEFRRNQFGLTLGGPVIIPRVYNGKNKAFWFFDYERTRIRQATPFNVSVPTSAERQSRYTDFSDLISGQLKTDLLGRMFPLGTVFDPATSRPVTAGTADPVTGRTASGTGFVRDPFAGNTIPVGRLDANAIKLLDLFPSPTGPGPFNNFASNPVKNDTANSFDARVDQNFSERDQMFTRLSYSKEPQFTPGPFQGIADGGTSTTTGTVVNNAENAAWSETHGFSPSTISELRVGFSDIRTNELQPFSDDLSNIPGQFGIQGIPQVPQNGGLPSITISTLSNLGSTTFVPQNKISSTLQVTENLTKLHRAHTFKGGFEFQHIKFTIFAPPFSRGRFDFTGNFTSIPNQGDGSTARAQFLLTPIRSTVLNGIDFVGGVTTVSASNIASPDYGRNYYGAYFQDDWKTSPKLTLNLGLRWDLFEPSHENFAGMANFIPGAPFAGAKYIVPIQRITQQPLQVSQNFLSTLAKDGIALEYSPFFGLGLAQKTNFAPRFGFAYRRNSKWVLRGGYGIYFGGFENKGGENLGSNYPSQFRFVFNTPDPAHPIQYADGSVATLEQGFLSIPLSPLSVKAPGLQLQGIQFNYITPYTQGYNATVQYQVTPNQSLSLGYVGSLGRHLETVPGSNRVAQLLPPAQNQAKFLPFPDFGIGPAYVSTSANSYYHSLQAQFERRFSSGMNFLAAYTWSKARTDGRDQLIGSIGGYRAPSLPGFGIQGDYGLADFDVGRILHVSGGYQFPIGRGRRFLTNRGGFVNGFLGGWSMNWILTLQDGQPLTIACSKATGAGTGCNALFVPGQDPLGGGHNVSQYFNPAAFQDPSSTVTAVGQTDYSPLGGAPTQVVGPGFHRLDWSLFKEFRTSERTRLEFRAEFFNLTNHPNFGQPGSLNFSTVDFGRISATRDNPNDPRQLQFALKFYW